MIAVLMEQQLASLAQQVLRTDVLLLVDESCCFVRASWIVAPVAFAVFSDLVTTCE